MYIKNYKKSIYGTRATVRFKYSKLTEWAEDELCKTILKTLYVGFILIFCNGYKMFL